MSHAPAPLLTGDLPLAHLPAGLVDSHCHLDLDQFDADRETVVARARAVGMQLIVNPGIDLDHCRQALRLAEHYPELYVAVGIHPNSSAGVGLAVMDEVRALAAHPKVVAIGEIGLDYYWEKVDPAEQARVFWWHLELAAELGLPVLIHNRDATAATAQILAEWAQSAATRNSPLASRPFWGVLHAFGGDVALAHQAYDWNFAIGLGGPVTFRNAKGLHELAPHLDLDRLLLETDAPYLTPHPYRGKRNEPAYVAFVCAQLAQLCQLPPAMIATRTTAVAYSFFGLEEQFDAVSQPTLWATN